MAIQGIKISELTGRASPSLGAVFPIVDADGNNYKLSLTNLSQVLPDSIANLQDSGANIINSSSGTGYFQWDDIRIDNSNTIESITNGITIKSNTFIENSVEDDFILLESTNTSGYHHNLSVDVDESSLYAYSDSNDISSEYGFVKSSTDGTNYFSELGVLTLSGQRKITASDSSFLVFDTVSSKGLEYANDYSNNFTDNSLVTKSWVESQIPSSFLSNLEDDSANVINSSSGTGYFQWDTIRLQNSIISSSDQIEISTSATNGSIILSPNGGTVTVPAGYSSLISSDADLINKKWIDDNIYNEFNVSTPSIGQVLTWDGNDWVNQALSSSALTAADIGAGIFSGNFTFDSALSVGDITIPSSDGIAGQALVTDGSGNLLFSNVNVDISDFSGGTFGSGDYVFPARVDSDGYYFNETDTGFGVSGGDLFISLLGTTKMTFESSRIRSTVDLSPSGVGVDLGAVTSPWDNIFANTFMLDASAGLSELPLTFFDDQDTGIYRRGVNTIGFAAGGVNVGSVGNLRGWVLPSNANPDTNLTLPENGSIAYDSTDHDIRAYVDGAWTSLLGGTSGLTNLQDDGDNVVKTASAPAGYFEWDSIRLDEDRIIPVGQDHAAFRVGSGSGALYNKASAAFHFDANDDFQITINTPSNKVGLISFTDPANTGGSIEYRHSHDRMDLRVDAGTVLSLNNDLSATFYGQVKVNSTEPVAQTLIKTLTTTEVRNAATTPVEIIPAQGANTVITVHSCVLIVDGGSVNYDGYTQAVFNYNDVSASAVATFAGFNSSSVLGYNVFHCNNLVSRSLTDYANAPIMFAGKNGSNATTGNRIVTVAVTYSVIEY